ncbi:MAG: hypothetical protein JWQ95_4927 [Sphaerisporangium sp.]|nr:hypothetical protein [Sphaerisporangium sp.]
MTEHHHMWGLLWGGGDRDTAREERGTAVVQKPFRP